MNVIAPECYIAMALETVCFTKHVNILRAFTKSLHVKAKSSISVR